jgi:hypothetical protein
MNLTMIWGRFFKDEDIKLTSFVTDLIITGQLHLIISFRIKSQKAICSSFIDLRKAFDSVWRKCLFYKLLASGVGHKTIDVIQNMYSELNRH